MTKRVQECVAHLPGPASLCLVQLEHFQGRSKNFSSVIEVNMSPCPLSPPTPNHRKTFTRHQLSVQMTNYNKRV